MNKNTIVLIFIVIGILILAYVVWKHNEFFKTQSQINSLLKERFPELSKYSKETEKENSEYEEKLESIADKIKENIKQKESSEDNPQEDDSDNVSTESEDSLLDKDEVTQVPDADILAFAQRIKDMEELSEQEDVQFYENNKQRIETALQNIASLDENTTPENDSIVSKPSRGRHRNDCICEKCIEKRKSKIKETVKTKK